MYFRLHVLKTNSGNFVFVKCYSLINFCLCKPLYESCCSRDLLCTIAVVDMCQSKMSTCYLFWGFFWWRDGAGVSVLGS